MIDFLHEEYEKFLSLLNKYEVKYLLIGGFAVNLYGYKRMTEDLDVLIEATKENGKKLLKCLEDFGYDVDSFANTDYTKSIHFRLGENPNTIDVINETVGINYSEAFKRAKMFKVDSIEVPVIHLNDLIENKKALNTFKDLADAEVLMKIKSK